MVILPFGYDGYGLSHDKFFIIMCIPVSNEVPQYSEAGLHHREIGYAHTYLHKGGMPHFNYWHCICIVSEFSMD